uniref:Uncharacterized protein n=1 Tax=Aegilops tauschii subsp. strangulata TaxID=200361 RepID=A0A453QT59_AEGTS
MESHCASRGEQRTPGHKHSQDSEIQLQATEISEITHAMAALLDLMLVRSSPSPRLVVAPQACAAPVAGAPGEGEGAMPPAVPCLRAVVLREALRERLAGEWEERRRRPRPPPLHLRVGQCGRNRKRKWAGPRRRPSTPPSAQSPRVTASPNKARFSSSPRRRSAYEKSFILSASPAMDQFHDRHHVRLRSCVLRTYLHADHDGERVSLSRRRDSLNTAWVVHIHQRADGPYLLLHSAAYGHYLGTTFKPAPLGHHGCRTEQRDYDDEPDLMAVMWKAARAGVRDIILLRDVAGRYLRANGRYLPWNTGVTVDNKVSALMYWTVEHIPDRDGPPGLPGPIHTPSPGYHSLMLWRNPVVSRLIRFMLSDPNGPIYTQHCWTTLRFRGRSVFHLRDELARRIAFVLDGRQSFDLVMCVRAGRRGRLTPLVIDLPSSGYGETLWIVVFMSGTPGL